MPDELKEKIKRFKKSEQALIEKAYIFAEKKHAGQLRRSGKPYISHPVNVATRLASDEYDAAMVTAALLHDTIEDTGTTFSEIEREFSTDIAKIVEGVTKISAYKIQNKKELFSNEERYLLQVDNYRKLLMAAISDLRVIIIKLYDRLHNIETVKYIKPSKQEFYARETMEIYAPIAERLGMGEMKGELEDLAFPYAYPKEYEKFIQHFNIAYQNPKEVVNQIIPEVEGALEKSGIEYESVKGRSKHHFSLFVKLKEVDISQVFDIVALRVVVYSVEDCYKVLGVIHSLYPPLPGRIFDYISRPRKNGYQSIHTTVSDKKGNVFEIQIRTSEMHQIAEYGAWAHWNYKEQQDHKNANEWIEELKKIEEIKSGKAFLKVLKEELFTKKVFIFTPRGQIIDLPAGSTPIDFAFRIHSDIGYHCKAVKVNGHIAPLKTILRTGDMVEITTTQNFTPKHEWLKYTKTTGAKNKIKHFLREQNFEKYLSRGKKIFEDASTQIGVPSLPANTMEERIHNSRLPYQSMENALAAIGEGNLSKTKLLKIIFPGVIVQQKKRVVKNEAEIEIGNLRGIRHAFAGCCNPKPLDPKIGYLTKNHIIKVHKISCKRIANVDKNRLVEI